MGAQVSQVTSVSQKDISDLLQEEPGLSVVVSNFHLEQKPISEDACTDKLSFSGESEMPQN